MKAVSVALAAMMLVHSTLGRDQDPVGCPNMGTQPVCEQVSTCKWSAGQCVDVYTCSQAKSKQACESHQQKPKACKWNDDACWRPDQPADKCTLSSGVESCNKIDGCSFVNGQCVTYDPCSTFGETDCKAAVPCRWYGTCKAERAACTHQLFQKDEDTCKRYGQGQCEWKNGKCLALEAADPCTLVKGQPLCEAVFGCGWRGAAGCKTEASQTPTNPGTAAPAQTDSPATDAPGNQQQVAQKTFAVVLRVVAAQLSDILTNLGAIGQRMSAAVEAGAEWICREVCRVVLENSDWVERECSACSATGQARAGIPLADESYVVKGDVVASGSVTQSEVEDKLHSEGSSIVGSGLKYEAVSVAEKAAPADDGDDDDGAFGGGLIAVIVCAIVVVVLAAVAACFWCSRRTQSKAECVETEPASTKSVEV